MSLKEKIISNDELSEFYEFLEPYKLPNMSLATGVASSSKMELFNVKTGDKETQLYIVMMPMSSQVIDNENPKMVEAAGIVYDRDKDCAWYVPPEKTQENHIFPTVRQAFHEGQSYKDREADYKYHFEDGETLIGAFSSNPVARCEQIYEFTKVESLGGHFPQKWLLETEEGDCMYLRERSGTIKMYTDAGDGKLVFHAFVGKEHPGTMLHAEEVLNLVTAVEYFNIVEDFETEVSKESKDRFWGEYEKI